MNKVKRFIVWMDGRLFEDDGTFGPVLDPTYKAMILESDHLAIIQALEAKVKELDECNLTLNGLVLKNIDLIEKLDTVKTWADELVDRVEHDPDCQASKGIYDPKTDETVYLDCTCGLDDILARRSQ